MVCLLIHNYIGWPGKVHDARVFVNSSLYRKDNDGTLLPDWRRDIAGVQVISDPWRSCVSSTIMAHETHTLKMLILHHS